MDISGCDRSTIAQSNPHSGQWLVRKNTVHRLMKYFLVKHQGSTILDVGCGNGWMANGFAKRGFQVCAIDLNYAARYILLNKGNFTSIHDRAEPKNEKQYVNLFMLPFYSLEYLPSS